MISLQDLRYHFVLLYIFQFLNCYKKQLQFGLPYSSIVANENREDPSNLFLDAKEVVVRHDVKQIVQMFFDILFFWFFQNFNLINSSAHLLLQLITKIVLFPLQCVKITLSAIVVKICLKCFLTTLIFLILHFIFKICVIFVLIGIYLQILIL